MDPLKSPVHHGVVSVGGPGSQLPLHQGQGNPEVGKPLVPLGRPRAEGFFLHPLFPLLVPKHCSLGRIEGVESHSTRCLHGHCKLHQAHICAIPRPTPSDWGVGIGLPGLVGQVPKDKCPGLEGFALPVVEEVTKGGNLRAAAFGRHGSKNALLVTDSLM